MRLPLRMFVGTTNEALTRPAASAVTSEATTRPSQRTVTPVALGVKLAPVTAMPVWPLRPMLGVISTPASGFSKTA